MTPERHGLDGWNPARIVSSCAGVSIELDGWCELDASGHIDDPALALVLPIEAVLHATNACADAHELWAMTGEV